MQCQNCGTSNEDTYRFCMKCGTPLTVSIPETQVESLSTTSVSQPGQPVAYIPTPQVVLQPSEKPASFSGASQVYASQPRADFFPGGTIGASQLSLFNIWGPFAGYGARRRHVGWLMDGQGPRAEDLTRKVDSKFKERQIPSTHVRQETLAARGLVVESRPYFILRSGLVSMALYISQFGRDLFVSLVSYLKPPISNFRAAILGVMLLFGAYMLFVFPNSLDSELGTLTGSLGLFGNSSPDTGGFFTLLCLVGPLGMLNNLALLLFGLYSGHKWLTEKDVLAGLRVPPNEFNEDDLMAMEKAVEQTVRISLDEIGLNPDGLKPIASSEGRRII